MSELIDAQELAKRLLVTPATVHAWHRRGWIPCLRAGRRPVLFDPVAVEKALRERAENRQAWPIRSDAPTTSTPMPSDITPDLLTSRQAAEQIGTAAKLRRAREAAERNRFKLQTAAELEAEQTKAARAGQGVAG